MNIKTPTGWRKGQTIFNFLQWLLTTGKLPANQLGQRVADPFFAQDPEWDSWWSEYLEEHGVTDVI